MFPKRKYFIFISRYQFNDYILFCDQSEIFKEIKTRKYVNNSYIFNKLFKTKNEYRLSQKWYMHCCPLIRTAYQKTGFNIYPSLYFGYVELAIKRV